MDLLLSLGWIAVAIIGLLVFFVLLVLVLLIIGNAVIAYEWDHPDEEDLPKKK